MEPQNPDIMELIARAPWREAVTYRETWPHEYVVIQKDGQQELRRSFAGASCEARESTTSSTRPAPTFSSVGTVEDIDPETYDSVLTAPGCSATAATSPYAGATPHSERSERWQCSGDEVDAGRTIYDLAAQPEGLALLGAALGLELSW